MARGIINTQYLTDIADAIREKLDVSDTYTPAQMAGAIEGISGGDSVVQADMPDYVKLAALDVARKVATGDGTLDLCRYDGGRASTSLSIGKIEGWHLLDRDLQNTHTITRDADGEYVLTPIEG